MREKEEEKKRYILSKIRNFHFAIFYTGDTRFNDGKSQHNSQHKHSKHGEKHLSTPSRPFERPDTIKISPRIKANQKTIP